MTTEILSILIVVGTVLVFVANKQLRRDKEQQEIYNSPDVVQEDAAKIRQELEETANEIIERMAARIDRLEILLREADRKSNILQKRLEKIERMEVGQVKEQLNDPTFSYLLNESINEVESGNVPFKQDVQGSQQADEAVADDEEPESYSIELSPDEIEAYLQSRSVDEIPDTPVKSLVDEEPEEYIPSNNRARDVHPQEQAAYLIQQMGRK